MNRKLRRSTPLRKLHLQRRSGETRAVIDAAMRRDQRYGSGDILDLVLFVIDEMRRQRP